MASDSDVEMQSALPKKSTKKTPKSPSEDMLKKDNEAKKMTTKDMIRNALTELKSRKGVSLYAIKKYVTEKYDVNPEKINNYIKKSIKTEIEKGSIIQTKGIGASGSFKLAPKTKPAENPTKKKVAKKSTKDKKTAKPKDSKDGEEKPKAKKAKISAKPDKTEAKPSKPVDNKKEKKITTKGEKPKPEAVKKSAKNMAKQTPAKKRAAMMKRKSIGSIIKPPKMKPKAR
ncbi:unnamed protein product [Chilo suppressalis]|uniref:H15 domain-containing protein n=1 Tax=Chilo suppressalis TaxID=168631 RepID=A0ABN8B4P2_CHISP|nr:unnamed protein product [Chilo suppressalis]